MHIGIHVYMYVCMYACMHTLCTRYVFTTHWPMTIFMCCSQICSSLGLFSISIMFTSCLLPAYLMFTWCSLDIHFPKFIHAIAFWSLHIQQCASWFWFLLVIDLLLPFISSNFSFVCLFVSHLKALLICENKCLLLLLLLFFFLFLEICFWIVPYFTVVADFFTIIDKDNREALESQHKAALLLRCFPSTTCHSERCS